MQRQSTISVWCERIIEGGWLLALTLIPTYFNLLSSRHFEPDKATTLRSIVMVMAAAGIIRILEGLRAHPPPSASSELSSDGPGLWRRLASTPMALPALCYVAVFVLATVVSVVPHTSFWGSYQRLQGTYTNLSYVALGLIVALNLRRPAQVERLITVGVLASLVAVAYGLVQHFQIDPLPWRGDVVSRVASTMGNSIFVAAYMIMVLPLALYQAVAGLHESRSAPADERPATALGWGAAYVLLVLGALALVFSAMQFGAVVRTPDLRYWWVYPGALVVAGSLFLLPTLRPHQEAKVSVAMLLPAVLAIGYALLVGLMFAVGQSDGLQRVQPSPGRGGTEWPLWMMGAVLLVAAAYALLVLLPRLPAGGTRLFHRLQGAGALITAALLLVTIFFTQSRGPWIGGGAALFVFGTLLLVLARRRALRSEQPARARLYRNLLAAEVAATAALGAFLVVFNISDAPVFQELRTVPYIGRMGRLLEVDEGTGLVRRLIWVGDDKAGGAVALITSDPLRAVVGWGPESMFVAFNRFYPPSLANIESRGASPDRSHQAYLDELINKGVLGLASYLFVLLSFFTLAWRIATRTDLWRTQALMAAAIALVAGHAVEGLTGIPIVSTLMLLWVTIGLTVAVGAIAGQYPLPGRSPLPVVAAPEPAADPAPTKGAAGKAPAGGRRRQTTQRGGAARPAPPRRAAGGPGAASLAIYGAIALAALVGAWSFNVDNVYADMRFQQGQSYTEDPRAQIEQQIVGTSYYLDAIRMEPQQDFYYLSLGRSLMTIVALRAEGAQGAALGTPPDDARVERLLQLDGPAAVQDFVLQRPPLELMGYARAVLERARDLNALNKDHYANLARMYNFWYQTLGAGQDPALLQEAITWYRRANEVAPQDVTILNEHASALARAGQYDEAALLLERSRTLDPRYSDTTLRYAELMRMQERYAEATDSYLSLLAQNPHALDSQIAAIASAMRDAPDQLRRLRDAYTAALASDPADPALLAAVAVLSDRAGDLPQAAEAFAQVVQLQPDNLDARQNYTLVLSDMLEYERAIGEAEALLAAAERLGRLTPEDRSAIENLINFFRSRAAAGGS